MENKYIELFMMIKEITATFGRVGNYCKEVWSAKFILGTLFYYKGVFGIAQKCKMLSLDTSSSKTGWAYFLAGRYKKSGVIDLDTKECKKKYKDKTSQEDQTKKAQEMMLIYQKYKIVDANNNVIVENENLEMSAIANNMVLVNVPLDDVGNGEYTLIVSELVGSAKADQPLGLTGTWESSFRR